jgi:hypothetical protein
MKGNRANVQTEIDPVSSKLPDMHTECSMVVLVCGKIRKLSHCCLLIFHLHNIPDCNAIEKNCKRKC